MKPYKYLGVVAAVAASVGAVAFLLVCLVDPLWYFSGNRITGINYPFNERLAKFVRFYRASQLYDCAIFGSSRTTLLNEYDIAGYRCFNFAVSSGRVAEFVEMARYLKHFGFQPKLIIVGVDAFNFYREQKTSSLPRFILERKPPPMLLRSYLSSSAVDFTFRTLTRDPPMARFYLADLTGAIRPGLDHSQIPECIAVDSNSDPFTAGAERYYEELRQVFPATRYVGYVPPLSVWDIAVIDLDGTLASYLEVLHSTVENFDTFYDFTLPSAITADPRETHDGDHYYRSANTVIAKRLLGAAGVFGLQVTGLSLAEYRSVFLAAYRKHAEPLGLTVGERERCYYRTNAR